MNWNITKIREIILKTKSNQFLEHHNLLTINHLYLNFLFISYLKLLH